MNKNLYEGMDAVFIEQPEQASAIGVISLFDATKEQRQEFIADAIKEVLSGRKNALDVHIQLKAMADTVKAITDNKDFRDAVLDEARKYGDKPFEYKNAKVNIRETGSRYHYADSGDSVWLELDAQEKAIAAKRKEREEFLKTIPEGGMPNPDTGEMIYRAAKTSTTSVTIELQ